MLILWGCVGPGQLIRNCTGASDTDKDARERAWDEYEADQLVDSGQWDTAWSFSVSDCNVVLDEVGDVAGDELGEAQDLGTLSGSDLPYFVCGYTSEPSNDGTTYTGDRDLFSFVSDSSGMFYFILEPLSAYTDVDAMVCDWTYGDCTSSSTTAGEGNSETLYRAVTSGERVNVVVYGRSGESSNYFVRIFR